MKCNHALALAIALAIAAAPAWAQAPPAQRKCVPAPKADCARVVMYDLRLAGRDLRGIDFSSANVRGGNFAGADLRDAKFRSARIKEANFAGADLSGATWVSGRICKPGSIGRCR